MARTRKQRSVPSVTTPVLDPPDLDVQEIAPPFVSDIVSDEAVIVPVDQPKPVLETPVSPKPEGPTVETLLWLALLLVAALLRFGDLGRWPLGEPEARLALAAWQGSEGVAHLSRGLSPLLLGVNTILFWVLAESDAIARLFPALLGTLALGALWLWRPLLGRGGALGAALLMALSPAQLFFSRWAGPEALSICFALLFLAGVARFGRWRSLNDVWLAAISLALGLTSGPGFWTMLVAGALWLGWLRFQASRLPDDEAHPTWTTIQQIMADLKPLAPRLAGTTVAIFVLAATGFGSNPTGLGAAFELPALWLRNLFAAPAMLLPFTLVVLFYELPIVLLGITGAALWIDEEPNWTSFLLFWAATIAVPATLLNSGWAGGVALVALPLALLGGVALARLAQALLDEGQLDVEGASMGLAGVIGTFLWLNLLAYIHTAQVMHLWLAMASLLVLLTGLSVTWSMGGPRATIRTFGLFMAVLLLLTSFRTAWALSFDHASDPREPLAAALAPADPDVRNIPAFLTELSVDRLGQRNMLPVALQRSLGAVPHWYLRHFPKLTLVEGTSPDLPIVAVLGVTQPAPGEKAIGQRYALRPTWTWPNLVGQALVRWVVTRDIRDGLDTEDAILYVTVP
jgi:hypothetical protein